MGLKDDMDGSYRGFHHFPINAEREECRIWGAGRNDTLSYVGMIFLIPITK